MSNVKDFYIPKLKIIIESVIAAEKKLEGYLEETKPQRKGYVLASEE